MSEGTQQQESNDTTEGSQVNPNQNPPPNPDEQDSPDTTTQPEGQVECSGPDVPYQVVQAQEKLPEGVKAAGFIVCEQHHILVTDKGFYAEAAGQVRRLPLNVLVDNL